MSKYTSAWMGKRSRWQRGVALYQLTRHKCTALGLELLRLLELVGIENADAELVVEADGDLVLRHL